MSSGLALAAQDTPKIIAEGRPAAPITEGNGDRYYERRRIKRTVPLDATQAPSLRWDKVCDGPEEGPIKAIYCNWDADNLYLAAEVATVAPVRFDLDAKGDGWFRGADNLCIRLKPDSSGAKLTAERFDTVQNPDRPVWAASPIPVEEIRGTMGQTSVGTTVAMVAIPRTELLGLKRKPGSEFGLRVLAGDEAQSTVGNDPVAAKPLLHLSLADDIPATSLGLSARFVVKDRTLIPGEAAWGTLELVNGSQEQLSFKRLFYTGSLGTEASIVGTAENEIQLSPGEKIRKDFKLRVAESAGLAALVLQGGVEREDGQRIVALTSYDRIEPFTVDLDLDSKPVLVAAPIGPERTRLVVVTLRSRSDGKKNGTVKLTIPAGWTAEGALERTASLSFSSEVKGISFKVQVPKGTPAGNYPLATTVEIAGRTYNATATLKVSGS